MNSSLWYYSFSKSFLDYLFENILCQWWLLVFNSSAFTFTFLRFTHWRILNRITIQLYFLRVWFIMRLKIWFWRWWTTVKRLRDLLAGWLFRFCSRLRLVLNAQLTDDVIVHFHVFVRVRVYLFRAEIAPKWYTNVRRPSPLAAY